MRMFDKYGEFNSSDELNAAAGDNSEPKMPENAINTKCEGGLETAGEDLQTKELENAVNTQCESDFKEAADTQADEEITESWRLIKEATQKIYLPDLRLSPLIQQKRDVAAAEENARIILEELKNIRRLMSDKGLEGQMSINEFQEE